MNWSKILVILIPSLFAIACSNNDNEAIRDQTNTSQAEYPKAVGEWIEARTFMMEQEDENPQSCDQIDFRVMANSGIYSVNECERTKSGQITSEEFVRLDKAATDAYQRTESAVCPEIFRFDRYYATINSLNDENDRKFDPDSRCYRGSESVVKTYKDYLRQLVDKYRAVGEAE